MTAEQETRERALAEAFVSLADTLVDDYDVMELLDRLSTDCVALLAVDAAGLLLTDQRGSLQVVSASTAQAHLLELFQVQTSEGPCLDCFHTSGQIAVADLASDRRWPRFAARARQAGYRAVHALPDAAALGNHRRAQPVRQQPRCRRRTCASGRRWPTWPPSASCRSARSTAARSSPSNYRSR